MNIFEIVKSINQYEVFGTRVTQLVIGLVVFIVFLILRNFFTRLVIFLLKRLESRTGISSESHLSRSLETSSRIIFLLFGLYISIAVIALPPKLALLSNRLIRSCTSFFVFLVLYRASGFILQYFFKFGKKTETNIDNTLVIFFNNAFKLLICVLGITMILQQWGYDFAALLTGLGLGGLAFALAAKDAIANLFGSVMIMLDRPFTMGDWIITSKAEGKVESIGFRSTRIRTMDQAVVTIPNSIISNEPITNMSRVDYKRMSFRLNIPSSIDSEKLDEFLKSIREMLINHTQTVSETVSVHFEKFNGPNLDILVRFSLNSSSDQDCLDVQEDINIKIKILMENLKI